jgi:hypothetical protein
VFGDCILFSPEEQGSDTQETGDAHPVLYGFLKHSEQGGLDIIKEYLQRAMVADALALKPRDLTGSVYVVRRMGTVLDWLPPTAPDFHETIVAFIDACLQGNMALSNTIQILALIVEGQPNCFTRRERQIIEYLQGKSFIYGRLQSLTELLDLYVTEAIQVMRMGWTANMAAFVTIWL